MLKSKFFSSIIVLHMLATIFLEAIQPPQLVVVMVIDQCAYHYFPRLQKHFSYGLRELLDQGVVYTQAYHAHGIPETTPGHHAISTGTLPWYHGACFNDWIAQSNYKTHVYDNDSSPESAMLNGNNGGKSYKKTKVDGFSDQAMLDQKTHENYSVFALSLKSYPAIAMANHTGKALWFNDKTGGFTSSKAYFDALPTWVTAANEKLNLTKKTSLKWEPAYALESDKYQFQDIDNYQAAAMPSSIVKQGEIPINKESNHPYDFFIRTPNSGADLFFLAKACIEENIPTQESDKHLLLWISLSNLDLIGHLTGPYSYETIDTLYHLDKQIQDFMNFAKEKVSAEKCLFVLTADHGIAPIPEILQKRGLKTARRVMIKPLIEQMNALVEEKFNIKNVVKNFEPTSFTINREAFAGLPLKTKKAVFNTLKKFLKKQPGIRNAWHISELKNKQFPAGALENLYKTQIYDDRIGDLICMPQPYCLLTNYPTGTSHLSPYEYDTHVPLIIYHKELEHQVINEHVWVPQIPATLAKLLNITKPAASPYGPLPGV